MKARDIRLVDMRDLFHHKSISTVNGSLFFWLDDPRIPTMWGIYQESATRPRGSFETETELMLLLANENTSIQLPSCPGYNKVLLFQRLLK
jgi:hypothetical protein